MKGHRIRHVFVCFLVIASLLAAAPGTGAYAATGRQLADSAVAALKASEPGSTSKTVMATLTWSWLKVDFAYKTGEYTYPITVDLLGSNFATASKVVYLLPGGGSNFASSYFTPINDNLAQYFRKAGYLVVGITPREDNAPTGISYSLMADWGMEMHRKDIRKVICTIESKLNKSYRVVGHSFGAAYALDYAGAYSSPLLEKTIALDIYSFDGSDAAAASQAMFAVAASQEPYVDKSYTDMKSLALVSMLLPKIDSGESRGDFGAGNFTYEGLFYFALIYSTYMEGADLLDWPLTQSYAAGEYYPAQCPLFDYYYLTKSDIDTVRSMIFLLGSGVVPYAVYRDFFDCSGYQVSYPGINWEGVNKPLVWLNTYLGYNASMAGAYQVIHAPVTMAVIPGYGHLDILLSRTAKADVWDKYHLSD